MTTILLAVESSWLRLACKGLLENLGYSVLLLDRPLAPLSLSQVVDWDAAVVDESPLGLGALQTFTLLGDRPLIGLGFSTPALSYSLALPLQAPELTAVLESALFGHLTLVADLRLDSVRSFASANGNGVHLTRTEFRLLQLLYDAHPGDVLLSEVLTTVWGSTEGKATSELVRSHLRNLRRKLGQIGLPDAIRSRRGLGYSLHI